ncbi:MAG TPA: zinc-binding dehydrogenase, partial [Rhabdaerophilum sp.]|nr:zinc-binding dehydrogenase [Rhabdaerophilum sp.]
GMQAATRARITPGDTAVVLGAGPIGTMVAVAALAGGCARAIVADLAQPKLDIAAKYQGVVPVNIREQDLVTEVNRLTDGWGADVVFECSGNPRAIASVIATLKPRGAMVLVGLGGDVTMPMNMIVTKELTVVGTFRFDQEFARAAELISSGAVDLKAMISGQYPMRDAVNAFETASDRTRATKVVLDLAGN